MEIEVRNCQIVTIPTKTHKILIASKEDISNVQKVIDEFFNRFEIIKIVPLVASKELIKPQNMKPRVIGGVHDYKGSVISQYLQIQDLLKDTFKAHEYYVALCTINTTEFPSVYHHLNQLTKLEKITLNNTSPKTYTKIHTEPEPMPDMLKERKNLINSARF